MKTHRKNFFEYIYIYSKGILPIPICLILLFSCTTEPDIDSPESEIIFEQSRVIPDFTIPPQDIVYLQALGFSGSDGVVLEKTDFIHDETYVYYLMEGDIEIRRDLLKSMAANAAGGKTEQFRTTNLVNGPFPRTIRIIAINMTNSTLRQGLTLAVENYNLIGINLSFTVEFRTVTTIAQIVAAENDSDILVKQISPNPSWVGQSGFPSGGNPFGSVTVTTSVANDGVNAAEHVFSHELGHTIGLRHTNYFNKSLGCPGLSGSDPNDGLGFIHIPGTPSTTNIDLSSIMLACFFGFESGEFSAFDLIALQTIY